MPSDFADLLAANAAFAETFDLAVARVRSHPLIPKRVPVGGFLYDVDTGLLRQLI